VQERDPQREEDHREQEDAEVNVMELSMTVANPEKIPASEDHGYRFPIGLNQVNVQPGVIAKFRA
jgi:hypothetical protein